MLRAEGRDDLTPRRDRAISLAITTQSPDFAALYFGSNRGQFIETSFVTMGQSQSAVMPAAPAVPSDHPRVTTGTGSAQPPPGCPMHESSPSSASPSTSFAPAPPALRPEADAQRPAACPVQHNGGNASLNPLNQMPNLSHERAPGQLTDLPTSRTSSTIPRPSAAKTPLSANASPENTAPGYAASESLKEDVWEYPSPQQFYNALVRKGWETPEDSVEMMVEIHNFLNEQAWRQVLGWEGRHAGGQDAILARFQGNPGKLSPRARLHGWAGWILPSRFR